MPPVHEHVHERASEQREPNQETQDVGPVLSKEKRAGDDEESDQDEPGSRRQKASLRLILIDRVVMHRHLGTPIRQ
jgi:hypothetical protein